MEDKINPWTLRSPITTLKTGNPNTSTATNIGTWQKNTDQRRKNAKLGNVSSTRKKDILQKTAKEHSQ